MTSDGLPDPQAAFLEAIKRRSLDEVMLLLLALPMASSRIEINAHDSADGQTALHLAAAGGDPLVVSLLLERVADATLADTAGKRAVNVAKEFGHSEVAHLLSGGEWIDAEAAPPITVATGVLNSTDAVSLESLVDTRDLQASEIVKLKALCAGVKAAQDDSTAVAHSSVDATMAYTKATTKKCPNPACGLPQTLYHGHYCHHVREGCYRCKTHFCYCCLATAEENRRERGQEHLCKCGSWSSFCDSGDLLAHVVLLPYPHDRQEI